ncbi:hypothetical protein BHE74_00026030 [Ensete ventricosum]|nr:hypothetical protein BHE74_00026030 [Ensete ventricosum]
MVFSAIFPPGVSADGVTPAEAKELRDEVRIVAVSFFIQDWMLSFFFLTSGSGSRFLVEGDWDLNEDPAAQINAKLKGKTH